MITKMKHLEGKQSHSKQWGIILDDHQATQHLENQSHLKTKSKEGMMQTVVGSICDAQQSILTVASDALDEDQAL